MILLIMGPPGAGKGSQSELIVNEFNIPHISTGEIFRYNTKNKTSLGIEAQKYMDKGSLVPDSITINMLKERLELDDTKNGFLLDGFPRTIVQAEALDEILALMQRKINVVLNIDVPENILTERLTGRRTCKVCKKTYHNIFKPTKVKGVCDACGGETIQRKDDNKEAALIRLEAYNRQTKPLIDFYKSKDMIKNIDGNRSIEIIFNDIKEVLND